MLRRSLALALRTPPDTVSHMVTRADLTYRGLTAFVRTVTDEEGVLYIGTLLTSPPQRSWDFSTRDRDAVIPLFRERVDAYFIEQREAPARRQAEAERLERAGLLPPAPRVVHGPVAPEPEFPAWMNIPRPDEQTQRTEATERAVRDRAYEAAVARLREAAAARADGRQ